MVSPLSLCCECSDFTTMSVLAKLSVWLSLQYDHVCAAAVLKSEGLDVDAANPVIPFCVLLGIDVHVSTAKSVGNLHLGNLIVADAVVLP